uniref:ATP synthase complex subunit 8 n=1 Tax=Sciopemyia fluviatilis TaxID=1807782 RepID=A0A343AWJ4_9DIPT|nr:ATP synthase F0 subunit 8 [Sciopemyia fluviatilis]
MPQMAPLMWLSLFFFFLLMYLLFNIMNYFSFIKTNKSEEGKTEINQSSLIWKW